MAKITFAYDKHKDAWSWVLIAKEKNLWGLDWKRQTAFIPEELMKMILKNNSSRSIKLVEKYLISNPRNRLKQALAGEKTHFLEKSWRLVEKKYFRILAEITAKPIYSKEFKCYITTGFMCPYNEQEDWFMASLWHSVPFSIGTIGHEIMHLQFLHYYKQYLRNKGLKKEEIENLKESLTFLLNEPEFSGIILSEDLGYPDHEKLREKLKIFWRKNRNFQDLVDYAILIIKKQRD